MYGYATTTISILRGNESADVFGDVGPSDNAIATGVIASIIDRSFAVSTPDSPEPVIVTSTTGRVASGTDIQYGDRIKDERSRTIYQIKNMGHNQNPMSTPDIVLQLSKVSDYGTS